MNIDIDDVACAIGDEVRDLVFRMIEDALEEADIMDEDERQEIADEIMGQWKDWV